MIDYEPLAALNPDEQLNDIGKRILFLLENAPQIELAELASRLTAPRPFLHRLHCRGVACVRECSRSSGKPTARSASGSATSSNEPLADRGPWAVLAVALGVTWAQEAIPTCKAAPKSPDAPKK